MIYHLPFLGEDIPELSPDIARVGDVVLEPPLPMLVQFINVGDLLDDIIVPSAVAYSVKPLLGSVAMCGLVQIVLVSLSTKPGPAPIPPGSRSI